MSLTPKKLAIYPTTSPPLRHGVLDSGVSQSAGPPLYPQLGTGGASARRAGNGERAPGARIFGWVLRAAGAARRQIPTPCYVLPGLFPLANLAPAVGIYPRGAGVRGAHIADSSYDRADGAIRAIYPPFFGAGGMCDVYTTARRRHVCHTGQRWLNNAKFRHDGACASPGRVCV